LRAWFSMTSRMHPNYGIGLWSIVWIPIPSSSHNTPYTIHAMHLHETQPTPTWRLCKIITNTLLCRSEIFLCKTNCNISMVECIQVSWIQGRYGIWHNPLIHVMYLSKTCTTFQHNFSFNHKLGHNSKCSLTIQTCTQDWSITTVTRFDIMLI